MKTPPDHIRQYLSYRADTGIFTWVKTFEGRARGVVQIGTQAGNVSARGYREIRFERVLYRAARLAWWYMRGEMPREGFDVDHRDGNRSNDKFDNLRLATRTQNNANMRARRSLKGAYFDCSVNLWKARIAKVHLGCFHTEIEAARACDVAALAMYGDFARLNFPEAHHAL